MKKIYKFITLLFAIILANIFTTNVARAETLEMRYQDNIYYVHVNNDGSEYSSYQLAMFYVDGKLAYCIEPGLAIYSTKYSIGDWNITSLNSDQRRKIELIGYYGYEYPGHQGNVKYYMAAQELIWKVVKPLNATWSTEKRGGGQIISLEAEKNEILNLISKHNTKPSFNNSTINSVVGNSFSLNDTNNVLSEYQIYSNDNQDVSIDNNTLNVKVNSTGNIEIRFIRKSYDNDINLIYYNSNSQKLAHTRFSEPMVANLKIQSVAGIVNINKLDKDTKKNQAQGEASLKGAIYDIFNENDEYITSISTDELGQGKSINLPSLGRYYLKEKSASNGYLVDDTKYYFNMTKDNLNQNINVYEKVISRSYDITKVYASNKTGIMTPEPNVEFGIYNKNNKLVLKKTTDKDGKICFTLPYGSYMLKQLTTTKGYEKIKDYHFEIRNTGEKINKLFSNAEITSKIKIIKVDENGNNIRKSGIKFKIKNIDTNKYVCQKITYPNETTICEYETTTDGTLITPYPLNYGNYQVEELDQKITGYLWNKTPLKFSINENSNIIKNGEDSIIELKFKNTEVKGKIVINKVGEKFIISNNKYSYSNTKLANVEFGVYDKNRNLIKKIYTDKNGNAEINDLKLGIYYIKELQTLKGYILDNKEYKIELTYKDQYTSVVTNKINLNNYLEKGKVEFTKTDLINGEVIPNTIIEIYTDNDKLIFTGKTDRNGKIVINNIKLGKYYILEKEAATGYTITDEKVYFEINKNGEIVKAKMKDKPITGTLEFTKTDVSTSEALPNTLIEIYNEKDELIFSGRTDENGKITIPEIRYGKYYIVEKEAPEGYKINEEKMYFEITEDGQVVKCNMLDEAYKVPSTGLSNINYELIGSIVLIISGLGLLLYEKNKRK